MADDIPVDMRSAMLADLVLEAIQDRRENDMLDARGRSVKKIYTGLKPVRDFLRFLLLVICILSKPPWCNNLGKTINDSCDEGHDGTEYYVSGITYIPVGAVDLFGTIIMLLIVADNFVLYTLTSNFNVGHMVASNKFKKRLSDF